MNYLLSVSFNNRCWAFNQITTIKLFNQDSPGTPILEQTILPYPLSLPEIGKNMVAGPWWSSDSISEDDLSQALNNIIEPGSTVFIWDSTNIAIQSLKQFFARKSHIINEHIFETKFCNLYNVYLAAYCFRNSCYEWGPDDHDLHLSRNPVAFLKANGREVSNCAGQNINELLELINKKSKPLLDHYLNTGSDFTGNDLDDAKPLVYATVDHAGACAAIIGFPVGFSVDGSEVFILDLNGDISELSNHSSDELLEEFKASIHGHSHKLSCYRLNLNSMPVTAPLQLINGELAARFSLSYEKVKATVTLLSDNRAFHSKLRDAASLGDDSTELHHAAFLMPSIPKATKEDLEEMVRSSMQSDRWEAIIKDYGLINSKTTQSDLGALTELLYRSPIAFGISWSDFETSLKELPEASAQHLLEAYNSFKISVTTDNVH